MVFESLLIKPMRKCMSFWEECVCLTEVKYKLKSLVQALMYIFLNALQISHIPFVSFHTIS